WHHSPSYPLLQPAVLANLARLFGAPAARLVFALLWLGLVLTAGLATWRSGLGSRRAAWVTLAVATTPFFVNPGGGGADSGYAEVFFAFALTAAAAGLLLGDGVLLAAATFLLPLLKPEGTVLVPIVALVLFVLGERRWWWPTLGAGGLALALQWQLQDRLVHHREAVSSVAAWLPFAAVAIALVPIGIRWLLDRLGCGRGIRVSVAVGVAATGIAILLALPAGGEGAVLGQFLAGFDRIGGKLVDLPTILVGLPASALSLRRFGLTFWLLLPALWLLWRRRGDPVVAATLPVVGLLALTLAAVFGAFLLSPETDVEHHLKSSAARLLSHQVGVIWLLIAVALPAANRPQPSSN
ncbi:MAG: hypothetical protein KDE27_00225, partial [Planctomycetes bacterium]|nr:hypothetical protein [Planctomycetota bacterium]